MPHSTTIEPIVTAAQLQDCVAAVATGEWLGIDTEFFREKTYYPLLCLVQIASPHGEFCVDVIVLEDVSPLQTLLQSPPPQTIIHSCRQDVEALIQRQLQLAQPYDTQLAAAFCGYGEQSSYAELVQRICEVTLAKSHTRANWARRPLTAAELNYAVEDVRYLQPLYAHLDARLSALGRQQWHHMECTRVVQASMALATAPVQDAWQRLKGWSRLPPKRRALAAGLATWREQKARQCDRPREWILATQGIMDICAHRPRDKNALAQLHSVNAGVVRKSANTILQIVAERSQSNQTSAPFDARPLSKTQKQTIKQIAAKLEATSTQENIGQSLLANRQQLADFVRGDRNIPLFQDWRHQFIGEKILQEFG